MAFQQEEEKQTHKLALLRRREEENSIKLLSNKYRLPYADLSTFPIEIDSIKLVPEPRAREAALVVLQSVGKRLTLAVRNPDKEETKNLLAELAREGYVCDLLLVSGHSLEHAWGYYKKVPKAAAAESGSIQVSQKKIDSFAKEFKSLEEIKGRIEKTFGGRTTEALEIIIAGALAVDASDVHLEPQASEVRIRFRLDGVLHDVILLPQKLYSLLLSRIKLVSELKLNVHDKAQDGRFTIKTSGADTEVRVSTLPGPAGENIVMRILNPKSIDVRFEELGMQPWIVAALNEELKKPNGMILTTGPTGSGKTTALYAFLKKIHTPEIKIITLEDPIEYHLPGIEQTQVDQEKGYDFANGLRAIVRQDPDVILVGEIRDFETADTAINAALTGHLVFSTLHTNDAAGAIPRLINLGIKPSSVAPALNVTMAQRLVRKLCPVCRVPVSFDTAIKKKILDELAVFPKNVPAPEEKTWTVYQPSVKGCSACNSLGYHGRIGLFEIILVNEAMEELILRDPSEYEFKRQATTQGQITMRQDGLLKILAGVTDFDEVERIVGA